MNNSKKRHLSAKKKNYKKIADAALKSLREFIRFCIDHGIRYEVTFSAPVKIRECLSHLQSADLVIVSRPSTNKKPAIIFYQSLRKTLVLSGTPFLVAGDDISKANNIVVAWDGSPEIIRTLKSHVALFQRMKPHYTLISCADDDASAQVSMQIGLDFLASHGLAAAIFAKSGNPSDVLLDIYEKLQPLQILLGVHVRNILDKKRFGKTSSAMLQDRRIPLFIYH